MNPNNPPKHHRVGSVQVVNAQTGEVVEERRGAFAMLPPRGDVCQDCAVAHDPGEPHDQQSLYYQMGFHGRHGRWPTHTDAMAHCDGETKARWRQLLVEVMRENGVEIPADLAEPL